MYWICIEMSFHREHVYIQTHTHTHTHSGCISQWNIAVWNAGY